MYWINTTFLPNSVYCYSHAYLTYFTDSVGLHSCTALFCIGYVNWCPDLQYWVYILLKWPTVLDVYIVIYLWVLLGMCIVVLGVYIVVVRVYSVILGVYIVALTCCTGSLYCGCTGGLRSGGGGHICTTTHTWNRTGKIFISFHMVGECRLHGLTFRWWTQVTYGTLSAGKREM